MKLTSEKIKQFIVETSSTHPGVIGELESHDLTGNNPNRWKRLSKRKLRTETDIGQHEHIFDEWPEHLRDHVSNWTSMKKGEDLIGCVERVFTLEDDGGEAYFAVISDSKDETIVAWQLNVD